MKLVNIGREDYAKSFVEKLKDFIPFDFKELNFVRRKFNSFTITIVVEYEQGELFCGRTICFSSLGFTTNRNSDTLVPLDSLQQVALQLSQSVSLAIIGKKSETISLEKDKQLSKSSINQ